MLKKIKKHYAKLKEYNEQPSHYDQSSLSWETPEFIKPYRGWVWKSIMALLLLGAVAFGYFYNALTFSLAVLTFAIVYALVQKENPKTVTVNLSHVGIKVGKRRYPFSKIKHFWIHYDPPHVKNLRIHVEGDLAHEIIIPLSDASPSEVREFLMGKIAELEGHHETLSELLLRAFKI